MVWHNLITIIIKPWEKSLFSAILMVVLLVASYSLTDSVAILVNRSSPIFTRESKEYLTN